MNHEIKFKGKRVDNGEWLYGWLFRDALHGALAIQQTTSEVGGDRGHMAIHTISKEVIPESVAQYIGLKDMVGTEIYHKDIMGFAGFDYEERQSQTDYFVVEFGRTHDVRYGYYLEYGSSQKVFHDEFKKGIVCGTVFENKNLIPHYQK